MEGKTFTLVDESKKEKLMRTPPYSVMYSSGFELMSNSWLIDQGDFMNFIGVWKREDFEEK